MASEKKNIQCDLSEATEKNKEGQSCQLSCTFVENMRDQPKAAGLVYSPRRPGKSSENDVKSSDIKVKSTKTVETKSSDTSTSSISFFDGTQKRKSLQILQPSADGQKLLMGGGSARKSKSKKKAKESSQSSRSRQAKLRVSKISEESSSEPERESTRSEATSDVPTSSDEAYMLMVQDCAPEKYWELMAEERRKALEETLKENMKLYEMIEELKAENEVLREKASHTDYFATMYKIAQDDVKPEDI